MKKTTGFLAAAAVACVATAPSPSFAATDEVLASTASAATFALYANSAQAYALTSADDIANWPVTYRDSEVVTATNRVGTGYSVADGSRSAGSAALPATSESKGGVWTLTGTTSAYGTRTAKVGVPYSLYDGINVTLVTSEASDAFGVDTKKTGPDRTSQRAEVLPIAYSCDDWLRDASTAATLTFLSPSEEETTVSNTGTGSVSYTFKEKGNWTVTLTMADGTKKTAVLTIAVPGLIIIFR